MVTFKNISNPYKKHIKVCLIPRIERNRIKVDLILIVQENIMLEKSKKSLEIC